MKKKDWFFVLFTLTAVVGTACNESPESHAAWAYVPREEIAGNYAQAKENALKRGEGYALATLPSIQFKNIRGSNVWHTLTETRYSGALDVVNNMPSKADFRLILLVDYQQHMFTIDGRDSLIHEGHLEPNQSVSFQVITDRLGSGGHNLVFAFFMKQPDLGRQTRIPMIPSTEINVVIGPALGSLNTPPQLPGIGSSRVRFSGRPVLSDNPTTISRSLQKACPGGKTTFYAHLGNADSTELVGILLPLVNLVQPPETRAYVKIAPLAQYAFPLTVPVPEETGSHEFLVFFAPNPFYELSSLSSGDTKRRSGMLRPSTVEMFEGAKEACREVPAANRIDG